MARVTKALTPVRGRRYRVTRLDSCGNPIFGDNGQVVTKGIVSAAFSSVTSEAEEIRSTNSSGEDCVLEPAVVSLEGFTAEILFCNMDPDMFEMMTGMPVDYDVDGAAVGIRVDVGVQLEDFSFGLEIWTGLASDDACGEVGEIDYGYILVPFMKGARLSDFTVENGTINFTIADASSRKGGSWGRGPYGVVVNAGNEAGPLLQPVTSTQVMIITRTKVAPPAATVGGHPLLNPAWPTQLSITPDADGLDVDFVVSPGVEEGQGVYWDFGDDSWDYSEEADGGIAHTYEEAGTYTVTARSGGYEGVTLEVTVTETS